MDKQNYCMVAFLGFSNGHKGKIYMCFSLFLSVSYVLYQQLICHFDLHALVLWKCLN
jgi:hypothetical protein